jgi:hypothetical protein
LSVHLLLPLAASQSVTPLDCWLYLLAPTLTSFQRCDRDAASPSVLRRWSMMSSFGKPAIFLKPVVKVSVTFGSAEVSVSSALT